MTAPIRDMAGLVEGIRRARDERGISCRQMDQISGLPDGYTEKMLAAVPIRSIGYKSLGDALGAVGKMILVVDDPEQIERVKERWAKRHMRGGAVIQERKKAASLESAKRGETPEKSGKVEGFARMQILGRLGGIMSGKKRRAKAMRRRELQRIRSHAARKRWARRK